MVGVIMTFIMNAYIITLSCLCPLVGSYLATKFDMPISTKGVMPRIGEYNWIMGYFRFNSYRQLPTSLI